MRVTAKDKARVRVMKAEFPEIYPLYRKWARDMSRKIRGEGYSLLALLRVVLAVYWVRPERTFYVWRHGYEYPWERMDGVLKYRIEWDFWYLGRKTKYKEITRNG